MDNTEKIIMTLIMGSVVAICACCGFLCLYEYKLDKLAMSQGYVQVQRAGESGCYWSKK